MSRHLLGRVLVPVANEEDARETFTALLRYLEDGTKLHVVHVIEKADGAPDKAPLAARRAQATEIFSFADRFLGETAELETELRYGTSVVDEIVAAAEESDATAILFVPRASGRLPRLLTWDKTRQLVATDRVPVVVLPRDS